MEESGSVLDMKDRGVQQIVQLLIKIWIISAGGGKEK